MSEVFDKAVEEAMGSVKIPLGGRGIPSAMGSGTKEGLTGLGERLYSEYEKLPWYKQLLLDVAPGTGETISAYETPIFAKKTKEAYEEEDYLATAGYGTLTGLSALGAVPFLGAGIRGVKAGVKGVKKGIDDLITTKTPEDSDVVKAFETLADSQRGLPESAMLSIQRVLSDADSGGMVLSHAAEHTGDLTHRMSQKPTFFQGYGISDKVDSVLRSIDNPANFRPRDMETLTKVKGESLRYAKEHTKLKVYNKPQWLAREAAIAVGEQDFSKASRLLHELKKVADLPIEKYQQEVMRFSRDDRGNLLEFTNAN